MAIHNLRRASQIIWDPIQIDQNDVGLGAVNDDDENGEVALFNGIQLKGLARNLEVHYKAPYQVQTRSKDTPVQEPTLVLTSK